MCVCACVGACIVSFPPGKCSEKERREKEEGGEEEEEQFGTSNAASSFSVHRFARMPKGAREEGRRVGTKDRESKGGKMLFLSLSVVGWENHFRRGGGRKSVRLRMLLPFFLLFLFSFLFFSFFERELLFRSGLFPSLFLLFLLSIREKNLSSSSPAVTPDEEDEKGE